jgi:hypothetical protein
VVVNYRLGLDGVRTEILDLLDDEWRTPTWFYAELRACGHKLGIEPATKVALILERLSNDGEAEIRVSGNRRKFRRRHTTVFLGGDRA